MRRAPASATSTTDKANNLKLDAPPGQSEDSAIADAMVGGTLNSAFVVSRFAVGMLGDRVNLTECVSAMLRAVGKVKAGSLDAAEAMLTSQAVALDAIFGELARRAALNMGEHLAATEAYMRLALKAQSQCRATLEALAAIKNPPVVYARQANINNGGHQQVNNGPQGQGGVSPAPAGENQPEPSKLLEAAHGERLDFGAQGAAVGTHQDLAPVGAVNRADERRR